MIQILILEVCTIPIPRRRLVGKKLHDGNMEGIFASTPPLEALRYIVHEAAAVDDIKGKQAKYFDKRCCQGIL